MPKHWRGCGQSWSRASRNALPQVLTRVVPGQLSTHGVSPRGHGCSYSRIMMNQRTAAALLAIGFLVSLASSMRAQRFGQANPAMTEASVDDAALGLTSRGFLQYSRGSDIYGTVTGG